MQNSNQITDSKTRPRQNSNQFKGLQDRQIFNEKEKQKEKDDFIKYSGLDKFEAEAIAQAYKKIAQNKTMSISFHEFTSILSQFYTIDDLAKEKIFQELEAKNIREFNCESLWIIAGILKQHHDKLQEIKQQELASEFVDAFCALGGNPDLTGFVSKQIILHIIKEEFELTFDMEQFLEKIESSNDQLDYQTFCLLFELTEEGKTMTKVSSVLSLISARSKKSNATLQSLKIRNKDFEKFLIQLDQQETQKMQKNETTNSQASILSPNIY